MPLSLDLVGRQQGAQSGLMRFGSCRAAYSCEESFILMSLAGWYILHCGLEIRRFFHLTSNVRLVAPPEFLMAFAGQKALHAVGATVQNALASRSILGDFTLPPISGSAS